VQTTAPAPTTHLTALALDIAPPTVQRKPSVTAEITCAQRAVESLMPAEGRLIDDRFAQFFVRRRSIRMRIARPSIAKVTRKVFDRRYPGFMAIILLRNRYYEDALARAVQNGIDQIVLLGAGYDTSAFRLDLGGATLFEVDAPPTQEVKREIIARHGLEATGDVRYVPCDFERDDLPSTLRAHGFDPSRPCLVAWLGVSYFLSEAAVRGTLADVAELSAPGSRLVWDYMDPRVIDGTTPYVGAQRARRIVIRRGEPYCFGVMPWEADALVAEMGFKVADHARLPELGHRYGGERGVWCRTDDFVGLMTARRCAAPSR
jgi:methyltransferase (TIGR00027 family)